MNESAIVHESDGLSSLGDEGHRIFHRTSIFRDKLHQVAHITVMCNLEKRDTNLKRVHG